MKFFLNRHPEPKLGKTDIAVIVDRKAARYLLIKDRRWDKDNQEWEYEGTALVVRNGILELFGKDYVYGESELLKVRGLN
jgi:hypothetical protein